MVILIATQIFWLSVKTRGGIFVIPLEVFAVSDAFPSPQHTQAPPWSSNVTLRRPSSGAVMPVPATRRQG